MYGMRGTQEECPVVPEWDKDDEQKKGKVPLGKGTTNRNMGKTEAA